MTRWLSTIGKKYIMALSGLIWFGYLIVHLWGNLKIFAGATFLNDYGVFLRTVGEPFFGYSQLLWVARVVLIPAFVIHIVAAIQLSTRDRASRPHAYAMRQNRESTLASRTMIWGGLFILLGSGFVAFQGGSAFGGVYQDLGVGDVGFRVQAWIADNVGRFADAAVLVEERDEHRSLLPVFHRLRRSAITEGLDSSMLESKLAASESIDRLDEFGCSGS